MEQRRGANGSNPTHCNSDSAVCRPKDHYEDPCSRSRTRELLCAAFRRLNLEQICGSSTATND